MSSVRNFFVLSRTLLEHPIWKSEKFSRGQAWADMIGLANHAPGYIRANGVRVDLQRGELGWSKSHLATRWRWTRKKVQRFFNELECDGMILVKMTHPSTVIRICQYEIYQLGRPLDDSADDSLDDPTDDSTDDSRTRRNKNDQKEKRRGTLDDFKTFASEIGATAEDAKWLYYHLEATGWKSGGAVVTDWGALMQSKKAAGWLPSCKKPESAKHATLQDELAAKYGRQSDPNVSTFGARYHSE